MAKAFYGIEEAVAKLGCTEEQLRGMVRAGKLHEFRDSGQLRFKVEDVDKLAAEAGDVVSLEGSGELTLSDSGSGSAEIPLAPLESDPEGSSIGLADSTDTSGLASTDAGAASPDAGEPDLASSGSGALDLSDSGSGSGSGSGTLTLEDSGSGSGELSLEDSGSGSGGGADIISLDEVDKDAAEGMKKDDTVITNIGISVFDDDDLEIAADPMAKTMLTGGDENLELGGSGGGSGLLDLTRESDDTSLGAELLEGIDMGDTADTVAQTAEEPAEVGPGEPEALPEAAAEAVAPVVVQQMAGVTEAASPAFTGLLIAGVLVMGLVGAMNIANNLDAWPAYLAWLADNFLMLLGGGLVAGGLFSLVGWFVGKQASAPRTAKKPKEKKPKAKKGKKGKKGAEEAAADTPA